MKNSNKQMQPTIKNQKNKFVYGRENVEAILAMVHNNQDFTEIDGKKITLLQNFKTDEVCNIIVNIEGI